MLRRSGLELGRFPRDSEGYVLYRALVSADPGIVLDVGANDGGFARSLRSFGYLGPILSFEPGADARSRLQASSADDPSWEVRSFALGDFDGFATLNVTANSGASSSLLEMLDRHVEAAPDAHVLAHERVQVRRLDSVVADEGVTLLRPALKIDVQGFERQVLDGCGPLLEEFVAVQLELSVEHLYSGAWDWREAIDWLDHAGFRLCALEPGFTDPASGRMLQFDAVMLRSRIT